MIFWETLKPRRRQRTEAPKAPTKSVLRSARLPYDKRCAALNKRGKRCRARIRPGMDFCYFHDPEVPAEQRRRCASRGGRTRRRLTQIPDGYLRPLKDRASIGHAMDRLYREVRLGVVTPDMGRVLFNILCRLYDTAVHDELFSANRTRGKGKLDRVRPKLNELLTQVEQRAWQRAVAKAPDEFLRLSADERAEMALRGEPVSKGGSGSSSLPAAS